MTKRRKLPPCVVSDDDGLRWASRREGEKAAFLVCMPVSIPLILSDNLTGPCVGCNRTLQWRPDGPKKPARTCPDCYALREMAPGGHA